MKYWENGFYLEQNKTNTRKEISDEMWQKLMDDQNSGKEIYTDNNGYPQSREHFINYDEIKEKRMYEIKLRLSAISEDIIQEQAGELVDNILQKKEEFINLHNELRNLLGKQLRKTK